MKAMNNIQLSCVAQSTKNGKISLYHKNNPIF